MASRFTELAIDYRDPERLATFWCSVLDFRVIDRQPGLVEIASWEPTVAAVRQEQRPPTLLFVQVPEGKVVKNRLHLDVSPVDRTQDDEVRRLIALGAQSVDVGQGDVCRWRVMQDIEGNEFCVLRSLAPG